MPLRPPWRWLGKDHSIKTRASGRAAELPTSEWKATISGIPCHLPQMNDWYDIYQLASSCDRSYEAHNQHLGLALSGLIFRNLACSYNWTLETTQNTCVYYVKLWTSPCGSICLDVYLIRHMLYFDRYLEDNPDYAAGLQLSQFSFKVPKPPNCARQSELIEPTEGIFMHNF